MPRATYRVQLHAGFGFAAAAEIAPYLAELGVSHLYASPSLQAAAGSSHGYDVVDHRRVSSELGGEEAHAALCRALGAAGLGQVLDIVPNHMAITERGNAWWWDVLENGPASRYASYFDVDWDPPQARLRNIVLLPILGDHYGRVLEAGEIRLVWEPPSPGQPEAFEIRSFEHRLPVAPRSLDTLVGRAAGRAGSDELAFLADALARLPPATATDRESSFRRHRDKEVLRGQLARLAAERPEVAAALQAEVAEVNADPDRLDDLLQRQNYQLAYWRRAGRELDYRRFFDVHSLAGLRTEDERVFQDTHVRILDWLRRGVLDGVRIDHPDGLYDPGGYLERLRRVAPAAWIVVEKILEPGERLPESWPVAGTTGYDFLNRATGLFVDPRGEEPLTALFHEVAGLTTPWPDLAVEKKHLVLDQLLASDVNRLAEVFLLVCERHRRYRDFTRHELRQALREAAACFPVYRTYARPGDAALSEQDRRAVDQAVEAARRRRADLDPGLFDLLGCLLRLGLQGEVESELVLRFQQLTGPAMAKGVEDTAFYTFNRLAALNEVGGDPGCFGTSPEAFHRAAAEAAERWPAAMLATSTHDTKRSEDVRARLALLSEIPAAWGAAVRRWTAHNERHRAGLPAGIPDRPDRNMEYLFYQTLVGAWPLPADRAWTSMEKAAREAKAHTSWTHPDPVYEEALRAFVHAALADPAFTGDVAAFVAPLIAPGRVNSLGQTLLKLAAPGVPDVYQGSELWDLSLVDPDNRRPVDFALRRRLLAELRDGLLPEEILARADEGLPKLWLLRQGLALRRRLPGAFHPVAGPGSSYQPLAARGARAGHCFAFARGAQGPAVVAVLPRLVLGLGGDWGETALELPAGRWRDELTGEERDGGPAAVADLLKRFPVALLARSG